MALISSTIDMSPATLIQGHLVIHQLGSAAAKLHDIGPNMADFATFIRDSVISVTDECDVTEVTL